MSEIAAGNVLALWRMWAVTTGFAVGNGLSLETRLLGVMALNALCLAAVAYDLWALRPRPPDKAGMRHRDTTFTGLDQVNALPRQYGAAA